MGLAAILGIFSLELRPTVMIFCCCLLPEMVYKTYFNFVKVSKCIYFTCGRDRKPMEVVLNHQKLPWVTQVDHLGHIIHESGSIDIDYRNAKGAYNGSSFELLKIFHFCFTAKVLCCANLLSLIWQIRSILELNLLVHNV